MEMELDRMMFEEVVVFCKEEQMRQLSSEGALKRRVLC